MWRHGFRAPGSPVLQSRYQWLRALPSPEGRALDGYDAPGISGRCSSASSWKMMALSSLGAPAVCIIGDRAGGVAVEPRATRPCLQRLAPWQVGGCYNAEDAYVAFGYGARRRMCSRHAASNRRASEAERCALVRVDLRWSLWYVRLAGKACSTDVGMVDFAAPTWGAFGEGAGDGPGLSPSQSSSSAAWWSTPASSLVHSIRAAIAGVAHGFLALRCISGGDPGSGQRLNGWRGLLLAFRSWQRLTASSGPPLRHNGRGAAGDPGVEIATVLSRSPSSRRGSAVAPGYPALW